MRASRHALAQAQLALIGAQTEEREARHLAMHDGLTSLPNRSYFRERLDHAVRHTPEHGRTMAMLYLDLDGFKGVNDEHGHDIGDELLRIVAARLLRNIRTEDLVSRLGGDEFACLLPGMHDYDHLGQLARKLLESVAAPMQIGSLNVTVMASIGIAICPSDGFSADTLLKHADIAMYRAKRLRSGYAFFKEASIAA